MKRFVPIARLLVVLTPLLALIPLGRIVVDWVQMSRMLGEPSFVVSARGYDWVAWEDREGSITAARVFPRGPAARAGVEEGDVLLQLDYKWYFNADALRGAVEGMPPGQRAVYSLQRDGAIVEAVVRSTRYPTFLYPLSGPLWGFGLWGFTLGAFLHVLGMVIAVPLAARSRRASFSLVLIAVSSLWMFGNLLRMLMVELVGPPAVGQTADAVFQTLTLLGLVGWLGFPALLLRKVLSDARLLGRGGLGALHTALYVPPVVLGAIVSVAVTWGRLGPLTQDNLIAPVLFYACLYIAAASLVVLVYHLLRDPDADAAIGGWNRAGSVATLVLAALAALSVLGVVPLLGAVTDEAAGWLVVATQLLSIAPVVLISVDTLKHGKVDQVVTRGLTYLTVLGLLFFFVAAGLSLIDPYLERTGASRNVIAGLYVVALLLVFERLARRVRVYAASFFQTERQRARQALALFQERMRTILDPDDLARETVRALGEHLGVRSAILFLIPEGEGGPWVSSTHHPEPPYLTERVVSLIWPHMQTEGRIWARNPELNESDLPADLARLFQERGAALAVPVLGDDAPLGLIVLGQKRQRGAVYNLEDLDLLRSLSGQLALAVERLRLVEREKTLVRESAEAQLVALRAQINPHFLFNALNTIAALVDERPGEAEATVEHLAAIFRHTLQAGSQAFVSMESEIALVRHYLHIERARFGERLRVEIDVDPACHAHPVPAFAVQTLVENAVKHGLERQRGDGRLAITVADAGTAGATVAVEDSGVGIPDLFERTAASTGTQSFFGIGLRNVAARLERLYGRDDLLRMTSAPGMGTTVLLVLPPNRPAAVEAARVINELARTE